MTDTVKRRKEIYPPGSRPAAIPLVAQIEAAIKTVDHPHCVDQIAEIQAHFDDHPGRIAQLPVRTFLIGGILSALAGNKGHQDRICATLRALPRDYRRRLEVVTKRDGLVSYDQVHRCNSRLARHLAPSTVGKTDRQEMIAAFFNRILQASVADMVLERYRALDWTYIPPWALAYVDKNRKMRSKDPDHDGPLGRYPAKDGAPARLCHVNNLHLAVTKNDDGRLVVTAMGLNPSGMDLQSGIRQLLDGITDAGQRDPTHGVDILYADRGYTQLRPENWAQQVAERSMTWLGDLKSNKIGKTVMDRAKPHPSGADMVDGTYYCPCMPETLVNIRLHGNGQNAADTAKMASEYDKRKPYAATRYARVKDKDQTRWQCPARAGKVRCPRVPESLRADHTHPTVTPTGAPGLICEQSTVTIDDDDNIRDRQTVTYGGTTWLELKGHRSQVESSNGRLQRGPCDVDRDYVRCRSLAKATMAYGFALISMNLSLLLAPPDT